MEQKLDSYMLNGVKLFLKENLICFQIYAFNFNLFLIAMLYFSLIVTEISHEDASVLNQECLFRRGFIQLSTCTRHVKQGGLFDRRLLRHFEAWEFI